MELNNTAEGGSNTTAVTAGNSGGLSGDAFTAVTSGGGGAITFDNTHPFGTLGYKFVSGTVTTHADWDTTVIGVQSADVWGRVVAYFTANPSAELAFCRFRRSAAQSSRYNINTTGKVVLRNAANTIVATSTMSVPLNQLIRLELHTIAATTNGTLECSIYSDHESPTADETFGVTNAVLTAGIDEVHWGPVGTVAGETFWGDALNLNTVGPAGPVKYRSRPNLVTSAAVGRSGSW